MSVKIEIVKLDVLAKQAEKIMDNVAEEKPLQIFLNKTHYAIIFCTPSNLKELVVGHLFSTGIVKSLEEIKNIRLKGTNVCQVLLKPEIDLGKRLKLSQVFSRVILSACGASTAYPYFGKFPKIKSKLEVKAEIVLNCVNKLNSIAEIFRKTGGVHVAALYDDNGNLIAFAEDVGRHNAVDKVIGIAVLNKIDLTQCFLALSGRLTGDIVVKAAKVGIPIIASLAAALDSGVSIAKDLGLSLIGFVRGKRMNIYSFPERILS